MLEVSLHVYGFIDIDSVKGIECSDHMARMHRQIWISVAYICHKDHFLMLHFLCLNIHHENMPI